MGKGIRHFAGMESERKVAFIDDLYKLGISATIELPELVVVGDQNTGKSSVLQAMTEISFPVEETMCTRFPIKISFRQTRSKETAVKATILPGPISEHDNAVTSRTKKFFMERKELSDKVMEEIVGEATKAIFGEKQSSKSKPNGHTTPSQLMLSDATLYVERSGPDEVHWTIVDLPGLVQNGEQVGDWKPAVTSPATVDGKSHSQSNAAIAEGLVHTYLGNKRNIVMLVKLTDTARAIAINWAGRVVVDSVDVERHRSLKLIGKTPGLRERSIGVLTKCDLKQETSDQWMLKLLSNKLATSCYLNHGWFGLRNRKPKESRISDAERDENETKEFYKEEWATAPSGRTGIKSLMTYVDRERRSQLQKSIPHILQEIREKLRECEAELEKLGEERTTTLAQQLYVHRFCNEMQKMADAALRGHYDDIPSNDPQKMLRFRVQERLNKFSEEMRDLNRMDLIFTNYEKDLHALGSQSSDPKVWENMVRSADGLYSEIWKEAQICQAASLPGSIHPHVEEKIFRKQSAHWERIARGLVEEVKTFVNECHSILLKIAIPDEKTRGEVNRATAKRSEEWNRQMDAALKELIDDDQKRPLSTRNPTFIEDYEYADRQRGEILRQGPATQDTNAQETPSTAKIQDAQGAVSKSHGASSISTQLSMVLYVRARLQSYYNIAMNRFVDNMAMQVIERHALGPDCPIRTVSTDFFLRLRNEELGAVAGEHNYSRRAELQQEQSRYQRALENWKEFNQILC